MDTVHECDRRTDRRTDRQTDRITITKTVQRRASHGKNGPETLKRTFSFGVTFTTGWWRSVVVSALASINEVIQHGARLLLGWVTGMVNNNNN